MPRNKLKKIRTENGFSRADLSRASTVSDKTLQRLEKGANNVRLDTKYRALEGLNILLRGKGKREKDFRDVFPNG